METISNGFVNYDEQIANIDTFYKGGSRFYKRWLGRPADLHSISEFLLYVASDFLFLENLQYVITEFGPQGGRWTDQIVSMLREKGLPKILHYHLIGSTSEHELVRRDVLTPWLGAKVGRTTNDCRYNHPIHVRSGNRNVLFSDVTIHPTVCTNLLPLSGGEKSNLIISMDNFDLLPNYHLNLVLEVMASSLTVGGLIAVNIDNKRLPDLKQALHKNDLDIKHQSCRGGIDNYLAIRRIVR